MNEETRKKMLAIYAQQTAKAANMAAPKDRTGQPAPTPAPAPIKKDIGLNDDAKNYTSMQDITKAANAGQVISISNLIGLIQEEKKQEQPAAPEQKTGTVEVSQTTFADIMPDEKPAEQTAYPFRQPTNFQAISKPQFCHPVAFTLPIAAVQEQPKAAQLTTEAPAKKVQVVDYSEKAFAVIGEGTKEIKNKLAAMGGKPNWNLKDIGFGWIFSKTKLPEVEKFLKGLAA